MSVIENVRCNQCLGFFPDSGKYEKICIHCFDTLKKNFADYYFGERTCENVLNFLDGIKNFSNRDQYELWRDILDTRNNPSKFIDEQIKNVKKNFSSYDKIFDFSDFKILNSEYELLIKFLLVLYKNNNNNLEDYINDCRFADVFVREYLNRKYCNAYNLLLGSFRKFETKLENSTEQNNFYIVNIKKIIKFLEENYCTIGNIRNCKGFENLNEVNEILSTIECDYVNESNGKTISQMLLDLYSVINEIVFSEFNIGREYDFFYGSDSDSDSESESEEIPKKTQVKKRHQ